MNSIFKRITLTIIAVTLLFTLTACEPTITPSVNFGFKNVETASDFNESLTAFEIGTRFYCCIKLHLITDQQASYDYKVEVIVPKTDEVDVKNMGGLNPDAIAWDETNERTILTYTIPGYREATPEKLLFYGTPNAEGEANIEVHIYNQNGEEVNQGYSRMVFFEYVIDGE